MKKLLLRAIATAALVVTGLSPAFAGERSSVSFSIHVADGHRDSHRARHNDRHWGYRGREHGYERHCDYGPRHRVYYEPPYYYRPNARVVVVERSHSDHHRDRW